MNHRHGSTAYGSDCLINTCIVVGAKNTPPFVENIYYYYNHHHYHYRMRIRFYLNLFRSSKTEKRTYLVTNKNAVKSKIQHAYCRLSR